MATYRVHLSIISNLSWQILARVFIFAFQSAQKQHSKECMCRLRNTALCVQEKRDYQESMTTRQMDRQTDTGQSDPNVLLCFAGDILVYLIHKTASSYIQKQFQLRTSNS